ncbi:UNVERIFIED_CONTAM: hypothetical protein GTU68_030672 [Idotea baltica]|nr:hypothetical protein [Idotea baltica]
MPFQRCASWLETWASTSTPSRGPIERWKPRASFKPGAVGGRW